MRRRSFWAAIAVGLAVTAGAVTPSAADTPPAPSARAAPAASAAGSARPAPAASVKVSVKGAPVADVPDDEPTAPPITDEDEMPAGHPQVDDSNSNPHAHPRGGNSKMPGVFEPPPDVEQEDPMSPPGTITVDLRDADDKPVTGEIVTLGIMQNSVAKGDSRRHVQQQTDAQGRTVFSSLDLAQNTAYRVSSGYQGGAFAATPFQLANAKAMHVVLHVYPVVRDITKALIVCEAVVAAELKDDRIQVEQALTVYNLGRTAWQPDDVKMALPEGYTAFNNQQQMSDQGVDDASGGARLRGTFGPGRNAVQFRWQIPWSGDKDVDIDVGMPPHVAIARVMMPASAKSKLIARDFPPPEVRHDDQGQSFYVTEKRLKPDDARLATLSIGIHDLPVPGEGRLFASLFAACAVMTGLVFAVSGRRRGPDTEADERDRQAARSRLLGEIGDLERAHAAGQVGPKTYERVRRDLVEALAHTLITTS